MHEFEAAEVHLDSLKSGYLRRWGWTLTCNTPGSYWLWQRDFADFVSVFAIDAFVNGARGIAGRLPTGGDGVVTLRDDRGGRVRFTAAELPDLITSIEAALAVPAVVSAIVQNTILRATP